LDNVGFEKIIKTLESKVRSIKNGEKSKQS